MLTVPWTELMPLHALPTFVDFRFTGNAISSLDSLGRQCMADNLLMDAAEKAEAITQAQARKIISDWLSQPEVYL